MMRLDSTSVRVLRRSAWLSGCDAFGALQISDVADDGVEFVFVDIGYGRHIAEGPVVGGDPVVHSVAEGVVAVMSDFV